MDLLNQIEMTMKTLEKLDSFMDTFFIGIDLSIKSYPNELPVWVEE